jgi:hypothetical protein
MTIFKQVLALGFLFVSVLGASATVSEYGISPDAGCELPVQNLVMFGDDIGWIYNDTGAIQTLLCSEADTVREDLERSSGRARQ